MGRNDSQKIKATQTAFGIVAVIKRHERARLTTIATELDLSKSAVYKHLSTLESLGYVVKEDGEYRLGLEFLDLGAYVRDNLSLYQIGRRDVDAAAERVGETVLLLTVDGDRATYIHIADAGRYCPPNVRLGKSIDLYSTPPGQVILAHLAEQRIDEILSGVEFPVRINDTPLDESAFRRRLNSIQDRGHAFERTTDSDDWQSVTAPVTGPDGHAVGAITALGPPARVDGKRLEMDIAGSVLSVAREMSKNMYDAH